MTDQQFKTYGRRLAEVISAADYTRIQFLAEVFRAAWNEKKTIYLCGNGGSAGNAIHLANDFTYGAGVKRGIGLRIEALPANAAVITCLANDIGYENIFFGAVARESERR